MKKVSMLFFAITMAATIFFVGAPVAQADDFVCNSTIGAITVDNLVVPQNRTCRLEGTRVEGNIIVNRAAVLNAQSVRVDGNIQAEGARNVVVRGGSVIGGDIQLIDGRRANIAWSRIGGTLLFDENEGQILARGNRINGDLQAFNNTGGVGLNNNRMGGNMQCKENVPAPTGSGNTASSKEDQCTNL